MLTSSGLHGVIVNNFTLNHFLLSCLQIVFGSQGVLRGITAGKCFVEMSTIDEETVQDVAEVSHLLV